MAQQFQHDCSVQDVAVARPGSDARQLDRLVLGSHACLIYEEPADQFAVVVPFIGLGLQRHERCLYVCDDRTTEQVAAALAAAGIDGEQEQQRGTLRLLTKRDAYLRSGHFDPEAMIALLCEAADLALRDGFTGLRVTGEMTWALGGEPGCDRLIEYEARLNEVFPTRPIVAICQYNRRRMPPSIVQGVLRTHPTVFVGTDLFEHNIYYEPPGAVLGTVSEADRVDWMIAQLRIAKAAQHALRSREADFMEAQRVARVGSWSWDARADTITWSDQMYRLYDLEPGQPTPSYEEHLRLYTPESRAPLDRAVKEAMANGTPYELDLEEAAPGTSRWLCARGEVVRDAAGGVIGLRGTAQDITARKLAEHQILHLNRVYAVFIHLSQAIVRATTARQLFDDACRIAVEEGGFRMAWVGVADRETRHVVPVAQWGRAEGYLDEIRISIDDIAEGRGPTGTAFREGRHVVSIDIAHDPCMAPWRESALMRGFRSSAALPLRTGGAVMGVYTVYAPEPRWFGDEEMRLLDAMAADVSLALDRFEAERQRAEAAGYARSLIEASLDPLVTISPQGTITDVNTATEEVTGLPRGVLVGSDFADYFTQPDLARRAYEQALQHGYVRDYPLTIRHTSGRQTEVVYNATTYRNAAGALQGVFAAARDVSGLRRVEQALRRERDFKAAVLDTVGALVVVFDPQGRVVSFNRACETCTGYSLPELADRPFWEVLIAPEERDTVRQVWNTLHATKMPNRFTNHWVRKDGERRLIEWTNAVLPGGDGTIEYVMSTGIDVTERRRAEQALERLNEELEDRIAARTTELEAANKELEAFSYSVSHDLRAPLRAVQGFSRWLVEETADLSADARRHVDLIRDNAARMGCLIDDLLAFSRASRRLVHLEPVDMNALVADALRQLAGEREGRALEVRCGDLPRCQGDPALLRQVLINLLSNAFKFTRSCDPAIVEIAGHVDPANPAEAVYVVRDNGVGFDMQYAGKLFGIFQRLHAADDYEGTGVGLAIVQRIVLRHGGRVWAAATVDGGAAFSIALPADVRP